MSNYIVLVKQVPDVSRITDNAFDPETGTLMRNKLPSVINELDSQALAFAARMKQLDPAGDAGKIIALTMGPPMAQDVLRYCLSRGADMGVLLTDRALGGADTCATANPLAFAVKKIVRDILNGSNDYIIVSGMQSVDGDTAQVPAQLAQELKIPCVAYATKAKYDTEKGFEYTCIISGGQEIVAPRQLPAVITVAKYEFPLFATVSATRQANDTELIKYTADDIKATAIGVKGSRTRVVRVFPPEKTNRKRQKVETVQEFAQLLRQNSKKNDDSSSQDEKSSYKYVLPEKRADKLDRSYEGTQKEIEDFSKLTNKLKELGIKDPAEIDDAIIQKILDDPNTKYRKAPLETMISGLKITRPSYEGEVWVMSEHNGNKMSSATFELIGKARDLADSLDTKVGVVLVGKNVKPMAQSLIAGGADKVYVVENDNLAQFEPEVYRKAVSSVIGKYWPQIVLFGATPRGRVLAPMTAYELSCGLTADCTGLEIRDNTRKGQVAVLMQTRPALGGNVMATICTTNSRCQMATARPGVMKALKPDESRQGEIISHEVDITKEDMGLEIISVEVGTGGVNFEQASIIVSGGRGMQNKPNYDKLVSEMCQAIRDNLGVTVEYGASRAAVEQGFAERIHQVGQTGTAVGPDIYIAMGISGAIQHMIGVANSGLIFAINNDHNAPIFKQCDYYIVGNAEDIVPELTKALSS